MLHTQPISTLRRLLVSREISPADLLRSVESSIAATDPAIGAYLHRDFPAALAEAEKAAARICGSADCISVASPLSQF